MEKFVRDAVLLISKPKTLNLRHFVMIVEIYGADKIQGTIDLWADDEDAVWRSMWAKLHWAYGGWDKAWDNCKVLSIKQIKEPILHVEK